MSLLLLFVLAVGGDKVVEARFTETPPKIDGVIEEVWQAADSASGFVQFAPYQGESPTEETVVYILQDSENLYCAFRCFARKIRPVACLTADEDYVVIGLDPFGSRTTAYYFIIYASEIIHDGWIVDDGRTMDDSWEGVWYRAVGFRDDRYEVEVKIPFKSIRYKKGLSRWGLQFQRYSAANRESDFWTELSEMEEGMVSKFGVLAGIDPQTTGHYIELYPEGYVRYDRYGQGDDEVKPRLSLNLKWDMTPEMTVASTIYPDFAQIESDPFILNLSQYPTYLSERRPFFVEGKEIFRMSDFGPDKGFFKALNIFYSRRIGKSVDGEVIPILGGMKLTHKSEAWNLGILGAYTDRYVEEDSVLEPRRRFGAAKVKARTFENSDVGVLLSGTRADDGSHNYAAGLEGVYRDGVNQFVFQSAVSDRSGKRGWAVSSGYSGFIRGFLTMGSVEVVQDSFDVTDVGFVPWSGRKKLTAFSGPFVRYSEGFLKNLYVAPGILALKEPTDENWSTFGYLIVNPQFRNNWGLNVEVTAGRAYEADTNYLHRSVDLSSWGNIAGQYFNLGGDYSYEYNYRRGFLGNQASGWIRVGYSIIPEVSLSLGSNLWAEWDTTNAVIALTSLLRPRIDCRINADMSFGLFSEFVMQTPGTDFGETELMSNRVGFILSWNFLPKSWLYVAVNDYRICNDEGELELENMIGAIKAKYLIYF